VPGPSDSGDPWGELPLIVDTSAWSRAHRREVRERFREAVAADRLRISPAARFEILRIARGGKQFDELATNLSAFKAAPLTSTVIRAAEDAMRTMAHRTAGAQRLPLVDYLLAAAAQHTASAVLHYDHNFDTLAEIMSFDSVWIAPPGSID
jgi:predicted nucleic acid-binding protein